MAKTQIYLR